MSAFHGQTATVNWQMLTMWLSKLLLMLLCSDVENAFIFKGNDEGVKALYDGRRLQYLPSTAT